MKRILPIFVGTILILNNSTDRVIADVTITVSNRVTHRMRSGAAASWHSILYPTVSHGGSAFGGSPPVVLQHERLWASMEKQGGVARIEIICAEIDWCQWQPEKGKLTWDSPEFKVLDRILAAQCHDSDVMLQCMWPNVEWLAFPEYRDDPCGAGSAPADVDAFAASWVTLLRELREKRGDTCVRWINLVNEPNFYWWLIPPDSGMKQDRPRQVRYLAEAMQKSKRRSSRRICP